MHNLIFIFILLALSGNVLAQNSKKSLLKSVHFTTPIADTDYAYPDIYATEPLSMKNIPCHCEYDFSLNLIDSICYSYNNNKQINAIHIFKKNSIETDSLIYNEKSEIVEVLSSCNKDDPFFRSRNKYFEMEKIKEIEDKSAINIYNDKDKLQLSDVFILSSDQKLVEHEAMFLGYMDERFAVMYSENGSPIQYGCASYKKSNGVFNYGKTPQWLCFVNKFLSFAYNNIEQEGIQLIFEK
jgi:hypothetical protein